MKEAVTKAMAKALKKQFPSIPIYDRWQEGEVEKPCIFLLCEKVEEKPLLGPRVKVSLHYRVSCYSEAGLEEFSEGRLREALAQVDDEGVPLRPMSVQTWTEEKVLHWEGAFCLIGRREEEASDWMETLEWKER